LVEKEGQLTNHNRLYQYKEPIRIRSKYVLRALSAGKRASRDLFWFYFRLVEKKSQFFNQSQSVVKHNEANASYIRQSVKNPHSGYQPVHGIDGEGVSRNLDQRG